MTFSDHRKFNDALVNNVLKEFSRSGAEYLILTSKDWVKIQPYISDKSKIIEAWYEHKVENEEDFIKCFI